MSFSYKLVLEKGITYIGSQQQIDGSFLSFSSSSPSIFKKDFVFHTTFASSLILQCLNKLPESKQVRFIQKQAARFLLSQKNKQWSWNYWAKESKEAKELPYPDDLDDTFCALSALAEYNPSYIDGKGLARVVQLLTSLEVKEGGPYITWLVSNNVSQHWKDVDIAVNANIAYFLSTQNVTLPNLTSFFHQAILEQHFTSQYYPSTYPVIYFLSRINIENDKKSLTKYLLKNRRYGYWENPLYTALAVSALIHMGELQDLEPAIEYLQKTQKDGVWEPFGFCIDPVRNNQTCYAGSSSLTTAFCLQSLTQYQTMQSTMNTLHLNNAEQKRISNEIYLYSVHTFNQLSPILKREGKNMLGIIKKVEKILPVSLLPFIFKISLGRKGEKVPYDVIIKLGAATLFGWIAYTIYDDFLDDEGNIIQLSLANVCLRELTGIFTTLLYKNPEFSKLFTSIMNQLDSANTWEVVATRRKFSKGDFLFTLDSIPNYGNFRQLSQKSFGYALGPLALLFILGYKASSKEVIYTLNFFKHFLIAKQLNDDMHDFEEDLQKGYINAVSAHAIKRLKKINNKLFTATISNIQEIFREKTIYDICRVINRHAQQALHALDKISAIDNPTCLVELLKPITKASNEAVMQHKKAQEFLSIYR